MSLLNHKNRNVVLNIQRKIVITGKPKNGDSVKILERLFITLNCMSSLSYSLYYSYFSPK